MVKRAHKKWYKKAITALMISSLLITLAAAVGSTVMHLGRAQVEEAAVCPVTVDLRLVNDATCYNRIKKELLYGVENSLAIAVEGLELTVVGAEDEVIYSEEARIAKAGTFTGAVIYNPVTAGEIQEVRIAPVIVLQGQQLSCGEQMVVVKELPGC